MLLREEEEKQSISNYRCTVVETPLKKRKANIQSYSYYLLFSKSVTRVPILIIYLYTARVETSEL